MEMLDTATNNRNQANKSLAERRAEEKKKFLYFDPNHMENDECNHNSFIKVLFIWYSARLTTLN